MEDVIIETFKVGQDRQVAKWNTIRGKRDCLFFVLYKNKSSDLIDLSNIDGVAMILE